MDLHDGDRGYKVQLAEALGIWDTVCGIDRGRERAWADPSTFAERYNIWHGREMKKKVVANWPAFENCQNDWDHADFFGIMSLASVSPDTELYLITDEGLKDGCAYRFLRSRFDDFVRWYEVGYDTEFFQPSDYIVFDRGLQFVRILHNEGWLVEP